MAVFKFNMALQHVYTFNILALDYYPRVNNVRFFYAQIINIQIKLQYSTFLGRCIQYWKNL